MLILFSNYFGCEENTHFDQSVHIRVLRCSWLLLQGIGGNLQLGFYLVTYDDFGKIACQKVGESNRSSPTPVFWIATPTSQKLTFSPGEPQFFDSWTHLPHLMSASHLQNHPLVENEVVCRVLPVNTHNDAALPNLDGPTFAHFPITKRSIWQDGDGRPGFGLLSDSIVIDLRHVTLNGCLLDLVTPSSGD